MTITREQIIEGRDEALEHLGIEVAHWEAVGHQARRIRMSLQASKTPLTNAAALTVAQAERELCVGFEGVAWAFTATAIVLTTPLSATDVALVA